MKGNWLTAICILLFIHFAIAQPIVTDTVSGSGAAESALASYQQAIQNSKSIYTGREHIPYFQNIEGFAYFTSKKWQTGSVLYDDVLYTNQLLLYDLVKDKLILKRFDGFAIELRSEKVSGFTIPGHKFIFKQDGRSDLKEGYYEVLYVGPLTMLARHTKVLKEQTEETRVREYFVEATAYYAVKEEQSFLIRNLSSVVKLTDISKRTIQELLRGQGITFKNNREKALVAIADYYNKNQR